MIAAPTAPSSSEPKTGKIYSIIPAILRDVEAIAKTKRNEQQRFMYRGVDDVYNAVHPLLSKHGMFITTLVEGETRGEHATTKGGTLFYTRLICRFRFFADDGSHVESVIVGEAMDSGDKATNKALSVAYKYAMFQLLCIPTEETTADPDAESHGVRPGEDAAPADETNRRRPPRGNRSGPSHREPPPTGPQLENQAVAHLTAQEHPRGIAAAMKRIDMRCEEGKLSTEFAKRAMTLAAERLELWAKRAAEKTPNQGQVAEMRESLDECRDHLRPDAYAKLAATLKKLHDESPE